MAEHPMVNPTTLAISVPRLIKSLLETYSKVEIAKYCKVTWMTVFHWSKGTFNPNEKSLAKLVEMYDAKPQRT